jgi:hypothetical protein
MDRFVDEKHAELLRIHWLKESASAAQLWSAPEARFAQSVFRWWAAQVD